MSENAPEEVLAEFRIDTLPGDPAEWPEINGNRAMPMSGDFNVRAADGTLTRGKDGFLLVSADGHPYWRETI